MRIALNVSPFEATFSVPPLWPRRDAARRLSLTNATTSTTTMATPTHIQNDI